MPPGPGEKPTPPELKGDWMGEYMAVGDWGPAHMCMCVCVCVCVCVYVCVCTHKCVARA